MMALLIGQCHLLLMPLLLMTPLSPMLFEQSWYPQRILNLHHPSLLSRHLRLRRLNGAQHMTLHRLMSRNQCPTRQARSHLKFKARLQLLMARLHT